MLTSKLPMSQSLALKQYISDLYQDNHKWLYVWLYQKLGSAQNAEDVLHDTFIKLLKQKDLIKIEQPKAYLTTTAKRILIDRARHQKIEQAYLEHLASQNLCDDISPEQIVIATKLLDQLAMLLEKLPERVQMTFVWHFIDGLRLQEIALNLGISSKTVHNDLVKALIHFQKHLMYL